MNRDNSQSARLGRKPHQPTQAARDRVSIMIAVGIGQADVSAVLGITQPDVAPALSQGAPDRLRADRLRADQGTTGHEIDRPSRWRRPGSHNVLGVTCHLISTNDRASRPDCLSSNYRNRVRQMPALPHKVVRNATSLHLEMSLGKKLVQLNCSASPRKWLLPLKTLARSYDRIDAAGERL